MNFPGHVLWDSGRRDAIVARVAVAGDFLPAGAISLPSGGWGAAAGALLSNFEDVSVSFVNLECPLDVASLAPRPLNGLGQIVSAESSSLEYLAALRCSIASVANNHTYDFGSYGVECTRTALSRRHIIALGAGQSLRRRPETFVWRGPGNIRIGFWAAALASRELATRRRSGVEPATLARAREALRSFESQGASFSIALLHAGVLRTCRPDPSDLHRIDALAHAGFGIVASSHSHLISGAKILTNARSAPSACFYGIGSIVSGYIGSSLEREGLIVVAAFHGDGSLARIEVRPVLLGASGFGEVPSSTQGGIILDRFRKLSSEIADGSSRELFYRDTGRGLVSLYIRDASAAFRQSGVRGLIRKAGRVRLRHVLRAVHGLLG